MISPRLLAVNDRSMTSWSLIIVVVLILSRFGAVVLQASAVNFGWLHLNRALLAPSLGGTGSRTWSALAGNSQTPDRALRISQTRERELQQAELWLQRSQSWWSQSSSVHANLADLYVIQENWTAAKAELRAAADLAPGEPSIHFWLGNVCYIQGQEKEAYREWRAAGALPYFLGLGQEHMRQQDWEGAEVFLQVAIEIAPDDFESRYHLGDLYAAQGRTADAVGMYEEGLLLEPRESADRLARRAQVHTWLGEWTQAVSAYRAALEQAPRRAGYAHQIGRALERGLGERVQAQSWYKYAIQLDSGYVSPYLALGRLAREDGRCEEALGWLNGARRLDKETVSAAELHYQVGRCEQIQGRSEAALFHLMEAVHLGEEAVPYRLALAQAHVKLGHFQEAIQQYRQVLELAPENRQARRELEELWARP